MPQSSAESRPGAQAAGDVTGIVAAQAAIKFNGGGHLNHTIFWENLCPPGQYAAPTGALEAAIDAQFGSLEAMQTAMSGATVAVQGSGACGPTTMMS